MPSHLSLMRHLSESMVRRTFSNSQENRYVTVRTPVNVVRFKRCTTMDFSMTLLLIMSMRKRKKYIFFPGHLKKMQHGSQLILKVNLIPPGTGTKNQMRICILVKPGTSADN